MILALSGAIYSRIAQSFALNRIFFSANENWNSKAKQPITLQNGNKALSRSISPRAFFESSAMLLVVNGADYSCRTFVYSYLIPVHNNVQLNDVPVFF